MQTYMQYDNLDIYDPAAILTYLLPNYYYDYYYRYHEYERFFPKLYKVLDSTKEAEILVHSMVFESPPPLRFRGYALTWYTKIRDVR